MVDEVPVQADELSNEQNGELGVQSVIPLLRPIYAVCCLEPSARLDQVSHELIRCRQHDECHHFTQTR